MRSGKELVDFTAGHLLWGTEPKVDGGGLQIQECERKS